MNTIKKRLEGLETQMAPQGKILSIIKYDNESNPYEAILLNGIYIKYYIKSDTLIDNVSLNQYDISLCNDKIIGNQWENPELLKK